MSIRDGLAICLRNRSAGCQPEDLEIGRADLEDVFLEIMQAEPMRAAA